MRAKKTKKYSKEKRHFVEKEKIEKCLICSICQDIFDEPYRITCGHTFCKKCLNDWEKKSRNELCPLCRNYYVKKYSGKDLIAQSLINESKVTCIYKGCPWKDKLSNLYDHIQNCLFEPGKLPDFMKNEIFFEKDKPSKKTEKKGNLEESEENIGNICSFNYTSSIKERIFSRNPYLISKIFEEKEEDKIKKEMETNKESNEKISENEEVNNLYNLLLLNNDNNSKKNIIENKRKQDDKNKENNNNENQQNLQGSSILNIFINPTITLNENNFLNKKIDRNEK
jgi:hypothetical protein